MILEETVDILPPRTQFRLAIKWAKMALPIWERYSQKNKLTYRDTVVGMTHFVDKELLSKTIDSVEQTLFSEQISERLINLRKHYNDPIVAMQDLDWELPYEVQTIFYFVYNLLDARLGKVTNVFEEKTIYVSINQAADAILTANIATVDELNSMLLEMQNGS